MLYWLKQLTAKLLLIYIGIAGPSPSLLAAPSAAVGTDPNHTHAQDARRVMLARKQNVNGYTVVQRRQIVKQRLQNVFAKQAAAGLSHQSAMETAAIHLPGFNFGRNPRPGPISTAERSVGGGPVERVAARSAVLVSLASGAEKAQRGASGLAHAHGAISRRESVPLMQRLADKMAHAPPMVPSFAHALQACLLLAAGSCAASVGCTRLVALRASERVFCQWQCCVAMAS